MKTGPVGTSHGAAGRRVPVRAYPATTPPVRAARSRDAGFMYPGRCGVWRVVMFSRVSRRPRRGCRISRSYRTWEYRRGKRLNNMNAASMLFQRRGCGIHVVSAEPGRAAGRDHGPRQCARSTGASGVRLRPEARRGQAFGGCGHGPVNSGINRMITWGDHGPVFPESRR